MARQNYRVAVNEESVIIGNDVIFKCNIQSHVADFVILSDWVDSEGLSFSGDKNFGNLPAANCVAFIFKIDIFLLKSNTNRE